MLVGVSYGSLLGHLLVAKHPEITRFVDFSGIAAVGAVPGLQVEARPYPPMLFVYGEDDVVLREPGRLDLSLSMKADRACGVWSWPAKGISSNAGAMSTVSSANWITSSRLRSNRAPKLARLDLISPELKITRECDRARDFSLSHILTRCAEDEFDKRT